MSRCRVVAGLSLSSSYFSSSALFLLMLCALALLCSYVLCFGGNSSNLRIFSKQILWNSARLSITRVFNNGMVSGQLVYNWATSTYSMYSMYSTRTTTTIYSTYSYTRRVIRVYIYSYRTVLSMYTMAHETRPYGKSDLGVPGWF